MDLFVTKLMSYLPADIDLTAVIRFILIVAVSSLILGIIGRVFFGKRSSLNHSVSSAIGILFVYAVTIVIYTFDPVNLSRFLSPLPFVSFSGDYLQVFTFTGAEYSEICTQVLNMIILAFLVNLLDSFIPKGKNIFSWYLYRFVTVALAMVAQLLVTGLLIAFLPGVLVTYAPIILIAILVIAALLGVLKVVLGLVLAVTNPLLGAVYAFFSSMIGKMLSKAMFTTLLLSSLVFILEKLGCTVICIAAAALSAYIPLILVLLIMWYILGHVL